MYTSTFHRARQEAARFLKLSEKFIEKAESQETDLSEELTITGIRGLGRHSADIKRAALDVSRAMSDLRQNREW